MRMGPADVTADLDTDRFRGLIAPLIDGTLEARTETVAHRHADGDLIPVEVLLQYVEFAGAASRIVLIARDIRDRVATQARLQRLAESEHARAAELNAVIQALGDGVIVCDAAGVITLSNAAANELFSDAPLETYRGLVERLDDPEGVAPALGTRSGPVELRLRTHPGEERWVEMSSYPVGPSSAPPGRAGHDETIVLLRDVTEARQRQLVRDTFLGVLSHELRTPITTIFAASKVLSKEGSTITEESRRDMLADISLEAERLHRLVEDLIALTRFGEAHGAVGDEPVLLQRIVPAVVASEEARWPDARFSLTVPLGLPTVAADPTYVEQVVRNLLSNAAKYGGAGVNVQLVAEEADGQVCVRILDDGPGFPAEEADRLFELFYRSATTATRAGGAGIGLFVCARLIQAMGGRVWARPRDDVRGAEFGFSLRQMTDE
jgi:signal transduction histidine kinase